MSKNRSMPKPTTGKFRAQEEREGPKIFREKMQATNKESGTETAFSFKTAALELKRKWSDAFKPLRGIDFIPSQSGLGRE